jgi:hypothetical protein
MKNIKKIPLKMRKPHRLPVAVINRLYLNYERKHIKECGNIKYFINANNIKQRPKKN